MINSTAGNDAANILFLGTGAADWPETIPPEQDYAGNLNWRRLSSALINGHMLIDCGPSTLNALETFNVDPGSITDILITHTHEDHLSPGILRTLADKRQGQAAIRLWAHSGAICRIPKSSSLELHALKCGVSFKIGEMYIKPLEANHVVDETHEKPLNFLFKTRSKEWLYATDGAWFLKPTWLELRKARLDAIVFDATIGEIEDDRRIFDHNSLPMIRLMLSTFRRYNVLKEDAYVLLTHMARTLHPHHDEVKKALASQRIIPAYDGLIISL